MTGTGKGNQDAAYATDEAYIVADKITHDVYIWRKYGAAGFGLQSTDEDGS